MLVLFAAAAAPRLSPLKSTVAPAVRETSLKVNSVLPPAPEFNVMVDAFEGRIRLPTDSEAFVLPDPLNTNSPPASVRALAIRSVLLVAELSRVRVPPSLTVNVVLVAVPEPLKVNA